jgi:hypothetical protein
MSDWMFQKQIEFGSKKLEMPQVCGDCYKIHRMFGMQYQVGGPGGEMLFPNARRLVELNNEVYDRLHPKCTCEKCTGIDKESMFVDE